MTKRLEWEIKDSTRTFWYITADYIGEETVDKDFFQSVWNVTIKSEGENPFFTFNIWVYSQYDEPVSLNEIWVELQERLNTFTIAILQHGRK